MSNKLYQLVERFYRSTYGMHRFLENYLGFEATVYTQGIANNLHPPTTDYYEKVRKVYGPSVNLTSTVSPTTTTKIFFNIYSISRDEELTSDLGSVNAYTFDKRIQLGNWIETNIGGRKIAFKVEAVRSIGFGTNVIYNLTLKPSNVVDLKVIREYTQ